MRYFLLILFTSNILCASCQLKKGRLEELVAAKQTAFPAGQDKKWQAIKELESSKEEATCDTLYSVYLSIDTTIQGFGEYYDAIINTLVAINTPKSATTIGEIYATKHPKFLSQSAIINLSRHEHYELFFPGIMQSLKPDLMNASWILKLLAKGVQQGKIEKDKLIAWLPTLADFYQYTKGQKDKSVPQDGLLLNIYYWIANPELAQSLGTIYDNPTAKGMLLDMFDNAKRVQNAEEKKLSWQVYQAMLGMVPDGDAYLSALCQDVVYRKRVYDYLQVRDQLNVLPSTINNQTALCEMLAVSSRSLRVHDTDGPASIAYAGVKEQPDGLYYFYWICWWKDCQSNSLVVVGPQPLDKTRFDDSPRLKGEVVKEKVDKSEWQQLIKNYSAVR